jgi:hypothetical protein
VTGKVSPAAASRQTPSERADKKTHGVAISNTSTHTNTATSTSTGATVQEKVKMFCQQLSYLSLAFRSKALVALVAYWVVGNGVFMVRVTNAVFVVIFVLFPTCF